MITPENLSWTQTYGLFPENPLPEDDELACYNGSAIAALLQKLLLKHEQPPAPSLTGLKRSHNPASRLFNWNLINQCLKRINCQVDTEVKTLLVNGDIDMFNMVLEKVRLWDTGGEPARLPPVSPEVQGPRRLPSAHSKSSAPAGQATKGEPAVDITKISGEKPLQQCKNVLQFFLVGLCRFLQLTPKQAVSLLSQNNKYFAMVLVKGVKSDFKPVVQFVCSIYEHMDHLAKMARVEHDTVEFLLQSLKPTLLSKNEEVVLWGTRILTKLAYDLREQRKDEGYVWLTRQNGGLYFAMIGLERNPRVAEAIVSMVLQFGRDHVEDLLTVEARKLAESSLQYLRAVLQLFEGLKDKMIDLDSLAEKGVLDYWLEVCAKQMDQSGYDSTVVCMDLLAELWLAFPQHFKDNEGTINTVLLYFKRVTRTASLPLKLMAIERICRLLRHFAQEKNPFASVLYKKLTFMFVENHSEGQLKEYILQNLVLIFREFVSIPIEVFLEPYLKLLHASKGDSYELNIYDFLFFNLVSEHPRLRLKNALHLLEHMFRLSLGTSVWGHTVLHVMKLLTHRFLPEDKVKDTVLSLAKVALSYIYAGLLNGSDDPYQRNIEAQRRAQVYQFLASVIKQDQRKLNSELQALILQVHVEMIRNLNLDNKGTFSLLSLIGEARQLVLEKLRESSEADRDRKQERPKELPPVQPRLGMSGFSDTSKKTSQSFQSIPSKASSFPREDYGKYQTEDEKAIVQKLNLKKPPMRLPKPDPKVVEQLSRLQAESQAREREKKLMQEQQSRRKEDIKERVKKELQARNVILGKGSAFSPAQVEYEEGSINEKLIEDRIPLLSLSGEEDRDSQSVEWCMRNFGRVVKQVFENKCTANAARGDSKEESGVIAFPAIIQLLKDAGLDPNKNRILDIMKLLSPDKRNALKGLDFTTFPTFLQQVAFEESLARRIWAEPLGLQLERMLRGMAYAQLLKVEDQDRETQQMNEMLAAGTDMILPAGFKKVSERRVVAVDELRVRADEKYIVCYGILNDLLRKRFEVSSTESYCVVKVEQRARRVGPAKQVPRLRIRESSREKNRDKVGQVKKEEEQKERQNQQRRRRKRKLQIERELQQLKQAKDQKLRKARQEEEAKSKQLQEEIKRKKQRQAQEQRDKKQMLQEYKRKQEEQRAEKERSQKEARDKSLNQKVKGAKEFKAKQQQMAEAQQEQAKKKKAEEEEEAKKKAEEEKLKKERLRKEAEANLEKDKAKREQAEGLRKDVQQAIAGEFADELQKWSKQVGAVFSNYMEQRDSKSKVEEGELDQRAFNLFLTQNGVVPEFFNLASGQLLFKNVIRDRLGMSQQLFVVALFYLMLRGRRIVELGQKAATASNQCSLQDEFKEVSPASFGLLLRYLLLGGEVKDVRQYLKGLREGEKWRRLDQAPE